VLVPLREVAVNRRHTFLHGLIVAAVNNRPGHAAEDRLNDVQKLSAGPHTISPLTPPPMITASVVIDGYSQPGASPNTLINGDDAVLQIVLLESFVIDTTNSAVRGLAVRQIQIGAAPAPREATVSKVVSSDSMRLAPTHSFPRGSACSCNHPATGLAGRRPRRAM
jgi:hypothetical protein